MKARKKGTRRWSGGKQKPQGGSLTIRIDLDSYRFLQSKAKGFETPAQVLRRLLHLDGPRARFERALAIAEEEKKEGAACR